MLKKLAAASTLLLLLPMPGYGGAPGKAGGTRDLALTLFGRTYHFRVQIGTLGIAVIVTLTALLAVTALLALIARRRLRQVQAANQKLEIEMGQRLRAEEEVRQLNAGLEQRVAERTRDLQAVNLQLAVSNKELEAFGYSVSHDLRAPLRGIDGWSHALLEDYGNALDPRARGYLDRVRSETQRMGVLIDDMLHLSHITRMELRGARLDLTALATGIAGDLVEAHPDRRIDFIIEPDVIGLGDEGLMRIVLTNLFSNAVKFTGPRPQARIEFGRHGDSAFRVRDNGVGFDMTYAHKLFGVFQRFHKESEFPGTGVGLATVQRIIQRHGGRIWAESQVGAGTAFHFTLGGHS